MAPRKPSTTSESVHSTKRSPSSSSATSSGVIKTGRHKNQWTAERRRKAVRLYFFTTISQIEIGLVLGKGYCKSDNERRIRELFLKDEVPSRSRWLKHNAVGHQASVEQWEIFRQYKVRPWKRSRHPTNATPEAGESSEDGEDGVLEVPTLSQDHHALQRQTGQDVTNRVNQLGNKYLPAHLRSISSVYCHSMTSTVRTSWASVTSTFRSSENSSLYRRSFVRERGPIDSVVTPLVSLLKRSLMKRFPALSIREEQWNSSILTEEEEWGWNILIDDDHFRDDDKSVDKDNCQTDVEEDQARTIRASLWVVAENRKLKPPGYLTRSFLELDLRPCRDRHFRRELVLNFGMNGDCKFCGCSIVQEVAHLEDIAELRYTEPQLEHRDFYDNTLLFYYITSRHYTFDGLKSLVADGADITVLNSSGSSFMHCFKWAWAWQTQGQPAKSRPGTLELSVFHQFHILCDEFIQLLEFLAAKDFKFSHSDEHGQTVAHLLFEDMYRNSASTRRILRIDQLERVLTAMKTDIDALDNRGCCVGQYLDLMDQSFRLPILSGDYEALIRKMSQASSLESSYLMLDFKKHFSLTARNNLTWPATVKAFGYTHLFDTKGDTPLIAMLKVWDESHPITDRSQCIQTLLELGTGIDLKDRRGNTALVIAARRGFRASVEQLLRLGANVNTVNYSGRSIMFMIKGWLMMAKRKDDNERYARIASCIPVLQQSLAIFEPLVDRQRFSAKSRAMLVAGQFKMYLA